MLCSRCLRFSSTRQNLKLFRRLSTSPPWLSAEPQLSTPISDVGEAPPGPAAHRSVCEAGTILKGLNYMKGGQDPVALEDTEYPEWLWSCLEVMQRRSDKVADEGGDEFSKSKKERRLAAKRQKATEAKLLAEGNLTALTNKIPLQHQSMNLPGRKGGSTEENIAAAKRREELRRVMRVERKVKIKESNYLKSM